MDATGVKEIAKMQGQIDSYELFLHNVLAKLINSKHNFLRLDSDGVDIDVMSSVIKEIDKLQNKEERK